MIFWLYLCPFKKIECIFQTSEIVKKKLTSFVCKLIDDKELHQNSISELFILI